MGGLRCAKAAIDGGRVASKAKEMAALAPAVAKAFELLYVGGDLTDEQVDEAMQLSYEMCAWAEWIEKRTAKLWAFYSTITGSEGDEYDPDDKMKKAAAL